MNAVALVDRQREEIEELRETIVQLRDALQPPIAWPRDWRLTGTEAAILSALFAARGLISRDRLMTAVYGAGWEHDPKIIDVFLSKMRRKLPFGSEIRCVWGQGYELGPDARKIIREAIPNSRANLQGDVAVAGKKSVTFLVDEKIYTRISAAAQAANMSTTGYARALFEAAYSARYGETGDRDLDASVAAALILSGAELDSEQISRALKISEATLDKILQAWRGQQRAAA